MPRTDPIAKIVEWFETAPPPAAEAVLAMCTRIMKQRRTPTKAESRSRLRKVNDDPAVTNHDGITVK